MAQRTQEANSKTCPAVKDLNKFSPFLMATKCCAIFLLSLFLQQTALAETVTFKSGDETVSAFLATPKEKGSRTAVILIHEWWGLNDWVKETAKRFSEKGYVALAIDLYRGKVATDADTAHQFMRGLPQDRALRDIQSAVNFLAKRPDVQKDKIGIIGWCMGGGLSLQAALNVKGLSAAVVCYGSVPSEKQNIKKLSVPLLSIFGETDKGIPVSSVKTFEKTAKSLKKNVAIHIYAGVGHAFMNPNSKNYGEKQAKDAWQKIFEFFAIHRALKKLPACDFTKTNHPKKCKAELKKLFTKRKIPDKKLEAYVKTFTRLTTEFKDELAALKIKVGPLVK